MDAAGYLRSLDIKLSKPRQSMIGRLVVAGEFEVDGARGVVIQPARGSLSERYLNLIAASDFRYLLLDSPVSFRVFFRMGEAAPFTEVPALVIEKPTQFPSPDAFAEIAQRLLSTSREELVSKACHLVLGKLKSEQQREQSKVTLGEGLATPEPSFAEAELTPNTGSETRTNGEALMAGYRLTPSSRLEAIRLLEWLQGLRHGGSRLNPNLHFLFNNLWPTSRRSLVVCSEIGAEICVDSTSSSVVVSCTNLIPELAEIASILFPRVSLTPADILERQDQGFDHLVVVPPLGAKYAGDLTGSERKGTAPRSSRVAWETFYVERALRAASVGALVTVVLPEGILASSRYAEFRAWVCQHARLVAVVSLPQGRAFLGSAVRCSLVTIQKRDRIPEDYPVLMMELDDSDISDETNQGRFRDVVQSFLSDEVRG